MADARMTQNCVMQFCVIQFCVMENPFEFGRELGIAELVDREEEVAEVVRAIRQGGKLFVIGPRRYGKTSILKAAEDRLLADGAAVLRYNAESFPTLDLLVARLVADSAQHLQGGIERAGQQVRKFFARLRPEVSFNINELEWTAKLGAAETEDESQHVALLVEALDGLEKLARSQPASRPVGLVIDEFQKIAEMGGRDAEARIRAAVQRHKRTGYVFAGSKTRLLTAMTMDAARPFYRLGSLCFVGPVPRADFSDFLRAGFVRGGFKLTDARKTGDRAQDQIELLLDLAEEVPYNVQQLAHACWEHLSCATNRGLTEAAVRQSLERVVRRYDPFYTQLWNSLTPNQQKTLAAVRRESGLKLQSHRVTKTLGKPHSTVKRAIDTLIARDILREEESLGTLRLRFEDPFFAHWISMFAQPL